MTTPFTTVEMPAVTPYLTIFIALSLTDEAIFVGDDKWEDPIVTENWLNGLDEKLSDYNVIGEFCFTNKLVELTTSETTPTSLFVLLKITSPTLNLEKPVPEPDTEVVPLETLMVPAP